MIGKVNPEPIIKINSIDLGEHLIISETSEMLKFDEPSDWSSLPKSAFVVTGIVEQPSRLLPENDKRELRDILDKLGGGIDLTLFSAVPSGSGLGTSSILGSAIIACLSRMLGQDFVGSSFNPRPNQDMTETVPYDVMMTYEDLFNRTLYLEQLMTTGGGWQDQIAV